MARRAHPQLQSDGKDHRCHWRRRSPKHRWSFRRQPKPSQPDSGTGKPKNPGWTQTATRHQATLRPWTQTATRHRATPRLPLCSAPATRQRGNGPTQEPGVEPRQPRGIGPLTASHSAETIQPAQAARPERSSGAAGVAAIREAVGTAHSALARADCAAGAANTTAQRATHRLTQPHTAQRPKMALRAQLALMGVADDPTTDCATGALRARLALLPYSRRRAPPARHA